MSLTRLIERGDGDRRAGEARDLDLERDRDRSENLPNVKIRESHEIWYPTEPERDRLRDRRDLQKNEDQDGEHRKMVIYIGADGYFTPAQKSSALWHN